MLEAFGWDVYNEENQPLDLREVIEEATVEVGEEKLSKKPIPSIAPIIANASTIQFAYLSIP
jgi:hypothetical protein